ncbi:ParB/RepB/Spo0J family partition protein [Halorubellus sp. PRR65]|uniref:ParB/RepB/Spo0J family partition protein n=1 Tax=Halorubellus sp. PRR65 TaxID=3098148 RepID=UPI002B25DA1D|nr:ParB/RepB/Spo0J family partition protein [Halorubellus sp. PRR65]
MHEVEVAEIESLSINDLEPHPVNDEVYGDRMELDEGFLASIKEHGIIEPIVVDPQPDAGDDSEQATILSGHRRFEAAKEVGLDRVPVRVARLDSDLQRRERLIEFNRNREKTFSQKMREAEELERIEQERAQRRQGTRTDLVENPPQSDEERQSDTSENYGKTRDRVGEKAGIGSGRTYDKAKEVWEAARAGDTVAQHEIDRLDRDEQSIHGAYQKVRGRLEHEETEDVGDDGEPGGADEKSDSSPDKNEDNREQVSTEDVVLSAHVGSNDEVFPEILDLHVDPGATVADVTYGKGVFWRQVPTGRYDFTATDIDPSRSPNSTEGVDCRDLPYDDASFDCVVLDPPYAEGFYETRDKPSDNDFWIKDRYVGDHGEQSATYHEAVLEMYATAGKEAHRVLREGGILITKLQDEVSRNEQRLTHIEVTDIYEEMGFHTKDLFVVVRQDTPTVGKMYEQRRARKNHSYFLIYEKRSDA